MEKPPSLSEMPINDGMNAAPDAQKGKLLNLWSRCIAGPSALFGSSLVRTLSASWSQIGGKEQIAANTIKRISFASKFLKKLPEVSLNCQVSASFSINSAKTKDAELAEKDSEKEERCRRISKIEHEIRTLERHMRSYKTKY